MIAQSIIAWVILRSLTSWYDLLPSPHHLFDLLSQEFSFSCLPRNCNFLVHWPLYSSCLRVVFSACEVLSLDKLMTYTFVSFNSLLKCFKCYSLKEDTFLAPILLLGRPKSFNLLPLTVFTSPSFSSTRMWVSQRQYLECFFLIIYPQSLESLQMPDRYLFHKWMNLLLFYDHGRKCFGSPRHRLLPSDEMCCFLWDGTNK